MKILIIDDDRDFRESLENEFKYLGYQSYGLDHPDDLKNLEADFSHAIIDLRMKGCSGHDFFPLVKKMFPKIKIVMLTAYGSIASSVEAIKNGADNYLLKPCSIDDLLKALKCDQADFQVADQSSEKVMGLYEKEFEYIEFVLRNHNGNISKAAEALGIARQSLQRKLKKIPSRS